MTIYIVQKCVPKMLLGEVQGAYTSLKKAKEHIKDDCGGIFENDPKDYWILTYDTDGSEIGHP